MKKFATILLGCLGLVISNQTLARGCDYYDAFGIYSPSTAKLISVTSNLPIVEQTDTSFIVQGTCTGIHDGTIRVVVNMNDNTICTSKISDGQFYFVPAEINTVCSGKWKLANITQVLQPTTHTFITYGLEYKKIS